MRAGVRTEMQASTSEGNAVGDHATPSSPVQRCSPRCAGAPHQCADVIEELEELRQSHGVMKLEMARLAVQISQTQQRSLETERIVRGPHSVQEKALRRAIMFATASAVRVLRGTHPEVSKSYSIVIKANSIRHIALKSRGVDCTLFDFRLLASNFLRQENILCSLDPPGTYALLCSTMQAKAFTIRFEKFMDIAEALQITPDMRMHSAYQEKKSYAGQLRCIRILGVDTVKYGDRVQEALESNNDEAESRAMLERKVLIGRSALLNTDKVPDSVHVLHQHSCGWSYPAWDVGFIHREDTREDLNNFEVPSTSTTTGFLMKWERHSDSPYPRDASPDLIPGTLKCIFPAVILRSNIITDTTRRIFQANSDGTSLQQRLFSNSDGMQ